MAVAKAVREGSLLPARGQVCADCGKPAVEYDHRDYAHPLVVVAVCHRCNILRGPGKWVKYLPLRELLRQQESSPARVLSLLGRAGLRPGDLPWSPGFFSSHWSSRVPSDDRTVAFIAAPI